MTELETNQQTADQICKASRLNGREFRSGEYVALLDGKVVAVANDLGDALRALRALDPNPQHGRPLIDCLPVFPRHSRGANVSVSQP
jgi:hypothetical protein